MKVSVNTGDASPTAHIAVNRNRLKHYSGKENGGSVYLEDGASFEIELFNQTQIKKLAVISIDGQSISSSGIVLRPGERVFLERWLDSPRKFQFKTYEIDGSDEAKRAIVKNGLIEVKFYDEVVPTPFYPNTTWISNNPFNRSIDNYPNLYGSVTSDLVQCSYSAPIETGRTEMGEASNQSFQSDSSSFLSWTSSQIEIRLRPISTKPVEMHEVRKYCTECGTRIKSNGWKFCPSCGTKL